MKIKKLMQTDWQIWKDFRLDALKNSPESFGSSYEEESNWPDSYFQNELTKSDIFGAFIDQSLVAAAGFYVLHNDKTKHRGIVWGMYTQAQYRNRGLASSLIQAIIKHAKLLVTQLHLTCVTTNLEAKSLYEKHGFKIYGTEPRALKIGNSFLDEHLMMLNLKEDSHPSEPIPNTSYKLYKNFPNSFDIIDEKVVAFDKKCVPATQIPDIIDLNFLVKEDDEVIAGICTDIYIWKILYISLLFVDEKHRNKDLGTMLIRRVEEKAKSMGATLAHTDTFDFQAKDFYLKQGYEIFGILDDCPKGHKRYYLKKVLS